MTLFQLQEDFWYKVFKQDVDYNNWSNNSRILIDTCNILREMNESWG